MQGFVDELVGYVGTVELGGVDVIDTGIDSPSDHLQCALAIRWRAEYPRTGKLHGPEAHTADGKAGEKDNVDGHNAHLGSADRHIPDAVHRGPGGSSLQASGLPPPIRLATWHA